MARAAPAVSITDVQRKCTCVCVFCVVVLVLAGIGWNRYQFSDAAATAFVICAGTVETVNQSRSDTE